MAHSSQQFYKLKADPFRLGPDHHFSFPHKTYKKGLAGLKLALVGGKGFIVVTGRPGTGKTTLLNEVIAQLDANKVVAATLLTTRFEAHDLWSMVASSFGLGCHKKSKSVIAPELESFLRMRHSQGKRALLIVDDAQGLGEGVLEELQLLSNLQDHGKPLLQIILIGSEELINITNSLELEDTGKRAISSSQLEPLSESETIDYIAHRLNHAGWQGDPEITKGAGFLVHHFSGGIAVIINRICHRFLLYGRAEEKHQLNADDMKSVLEELSEEQLLSINTAVFLDLEEKINMLENESIQPLKRIKKTSIETLITKDDDAVIQLDTRRQDPVNAAPHIEAPLTRQDDNTATKTSGPAEYPGGFNNPASTTDESTDKVSAENNSCGDTRDSNDESQLHIEATAIAPPDSPGERSRWRGNYAWLAVPAAIVIAVGLKIYPGTPQVHTQIQSQADIVSRSPAHQIQLAEKTQLDETAIGASKTSTAQQAKIHELVTNTAPVLTEITPELMPARTVNTAPPVIAKPAEPTGEKSSTAETKTATDPAPQQPLITTTAPDISVEPTEPAQVAASGESALPEKVEPAEPIGENPSAAETKTEKGPVPQPLKTTTAADISVEPTEPTQLAAPGESTLPGKVESAEPTGEKSPAAETKTAKGPVPQPLKTTTAADISAEPVETTQVAASGESVLPGKAVPANIAQSRTAPVKQVSKPLAQPSPKVKETTETPTPAKAAPVIVQPEKSSKPAAKKPQKARVTRKVTKAAGSASQTKNTLLANQWVTNTRQQAAQLPSFITNCSAKRGSIECWSSEHFIEKSKKSVGVKTKSYLKDFTKSGFAIKYKHMLLGGANEKRRWEKETHQLDCTITDGNKIKCREDGVNGAVIFTRNTSNQ